MLNKNLNIPKTLAITIIATLFVSSTVLIYNFKRRRRKLSSKWTGVATTGYVFNLIKNADSIKVSVVPKGKYYKVYLNDKLSGKMWQDAQGLQWNTNSKSLIPLASRIADQINKIFTRKGFSSILQGAYPEILSARWSGDETLEILLEEKTDVEVFVTFFKDEVLNLVDFEEHLDILVKTRGKQYFTLVSLN
ncbi:hypothetical protein [Pedobacter aquatilis]|uniref:hypothetical protein n=1 Tax=Pedobacter aquatilis TaxID=351343 RepID=UPI00293195EF|nr:hypothetical protein [Pedobacter aquatilis]